MCRNPPANIVAYGPNAHPIRTLGQPTHFTYPAAARQPPARSLPPEPAGVSEPACTPAPVAAPLSRHRSTVRRHECQKPPTQQTALAADASIGPREYGRLLHRSRLAPVSTVHAYANAVRTFPTWGRGCLLPTSPHRYRSTDARPSHSGAGRSLGFTASTRKSAPHPNHGQPLREELQVAAPSDQPPYAPLQPLPPHRDLPRAGDLFAN
jgi:hypothetical protein